MDSIVDCGAIPVLVERLKPPTPQIADGAEAIKYEFEVEKACALALGLISDKVNSLFSFSAFNYDVLEKYA